MECRLIVLDFGCIFDVRYLGRDYFLAFQHSAFSFSWLICFEGGVCCLTFEL